MIRVTTPLGDRRIVVTRAAEDAGALVARLAALGAVPVVCPAIAFGPPPDAAALDAALGTDDADWVVFTSATGVRVALDRVRLGNRATPAWVSARVAAIGPSTASALRAENIRVDFVPQTFVGEALAETLPEVAGRRVLLIRAQEGRDVLPERLTARGATVLDAVAYTTLPAPLSAATRAALGDGVDAITFTAASTVHHLIAALGGAAPRLLTAAALVTIGPITSDAVRAHGLSVAAEADSATLDGLVDALVSYFGAVPAAGMRAK